MVAIDADDDTVSTLEGKPGYIVVKLRGPGRAVGDAEAGRIVASVAVLADRHMARRQTHCNRAIVAALAVGRYIFVIVVDMAVLALESNMRPFRRDRRSLVVVPFIVAGLGGRRQERRDEDRQQQRQNHQPDPPHPSALSGPHHR